MAEDVEWRDVLECRLIRAVHKERKYVRCFVVGECGERTGRGRRGSRGKNP